MRWRQAVRAAIAAAVGLWLTSGHVLAQGCAMCRTAVEGQDDPLTRGISRSVLFMISMPFAVFFSAAGWLVFTNRRGRTAPPPPAEDAGANGGTETLEGA